MGHPLKIQNLTAEGLNPLQDIRFCSSSITIKGDQPVRNFSVVEKIMYQTAVALITALHHIGPPSDLLKKPGKTARSLATAPAIDERSPRALVVAQLLFDMIRCIAKNHRRTDFAGQKRAFLNVDRPNLGPFLIIENRQIDGTRQMILCELGGTPHVNNTIVSLRVYFG